MSWTIDAEVEGLPIRIIGDYRRGELLGFLPGSDVVKEAINRNDPCVLLAISWMVSEDAKEFCAAQWIEEDTEYLFDNCMGRKDREYLDRALANKYLSNKSRRLIEDYLIILEEKEKQAAIKKTSRGYRRYQFQKNRDRLMASLIERDGYTCRECGASENLEIDHIYPLSKGGSDDLDNLQFLCRKHNLIKGDKI